MYSRIFALIALAVGLVSLFSFSLCAAAEPRRPLDKTTVDTLDLARYLGQWYEIARKPHFFERGLTHAKATYTLRPDGRIDVLNEGIKNGKPKSAKGKARTTDVAGQLKVTFFLFPGEYNVLELGPDYSYSVVGGSDEGYLWILSRTPTMEPEVLNGIYSRLRERGYDLSDLILVEQ